MKYPIFFVLIILSSFSAADTTFKLKVEVPELEVDPYFKPYVAIWLEDETRAPLDTIALWYQIESNTNAQEDGKKWLKDLRQWWRKIGRSSMDNMDGVSGATRRPGVYDFTWVLSNETLTQLNTKKIILHVEASREEGGRSYQRLTVNMHSASVHTVQPEGELGLITLKVEVTEND